jgi:cellulose synthase operon protein C
VCGRPPLLGEDMKRSVAVRLSLVGFLIAALLTGCTRDPNVRKQKFLESGNRYRDQGKLREAVIQYLNAIQVDPRFAEAHYQLAETYLKLGDGDRGGQELIRTVDLDPDNYRARADLANLLVMAAHNPDGSLRQNYQDLLKQAKIHLDFLRSTQPDSPDTHLAWANFYAGQGMLEPAVQEVNRAIQADPNRSDSYLDLAQLQSVKQPDQAEMNFKKAIRLAPKAVNAQLALGRFYMSHNRVPEAEQQFQQAIAADPKDTAPRTDYVRALMAEGKKTEVEAFLKQTKSDLPDNSEGYRMLGDYYSQVLGDLDRATAEYASLYADHPKDPQVKKNYIQLLILKNRLDEANKLNDEVLKSSPHDAAALVYRGQIQIAQGNAAGAVDSLQQALKSDSNNATAHYHLGRAFDMQHNEAQAESEWRAAVSVRPDLTDAQRALAGLEILHGDVDALAQTAQQVIQFAPSAPDGYLDRALAEMSRQRFSDAEQDMRKAAELAPGNPIPYVQMGNLHQVQKQYTEAMKFYQQALGMDPSSTDGLQGLMRAYIAQKQADQAIAAARAQIAKVPNSSGFYDLLGTALFEQKQDFAGADAALHKAIELDKNNSDALLKLAQVQVAEGSISQALTTDLQSIKDHPRDISFYILAGAMYEKQSNWDQAKAMYQQALNIQPDSGLASNNLAWLMLEHGGNVDVALAMAQTARRGAPNSPQAADTLGWAYLKKGVYQSAIDMFQESLRLSEKNGASDDPDVHYHLGLAYQKTNQPSQARQQLERALKISPNFSEAGDARKVLAELHG